MKLRHLLSGFLLAGAAVSAVSAAPVSSTCVAVAGERILASDLAKAVPIFSAVPGTTEIGYAPFPGARRNFHTPELQNLAARHQLSVAAGTEVCFERILETLKAEPVIEAMRKSLGDPTARIEITELSRYPVPQGDITFARSALPARSDASVLWRGFVQYGGQRKFVIWARALIRVRSTRPVAVSDLVPGHRIEAQQVRVEEREVYPSTGPAAPSLDSIVGKLPRHSITAGTAIEASLLEEPKDVERGDVVKVDVESGAAHLKLEGRAQAGGRMGDAIRVRNLSNGKSFSARITEKGKVVLNASQASNTKDGIQ